jgi:phospho-N-acetylmuramoyl-pentapeptide-transferase
MPVYATALTAFFLSLILCPLYIRYSPFGQQIRSDGPGKHFRKAGTPTMGGVVFLFSALLILLLFVPMTPLLLATVLMMLAGGLLGLLDDYRKAARHRSLGLKARHKLAGQFVFSVLFYFVLVQYGHSTVVQIPFSEMAVDFGYLYPLLIFIMITGTANGVNLTDGIDGLAGGTAILAMLAFLILASQQGQSDLVYFCAVIIGAVFGFLIFNLHPARVFMGDVGSLSLGTVLAVVAILTKAEFLLVIIGGVFVLETLSVILQVISFRLTGRRVFLMSPLHHHFEIKGWSEWHVVTGFWALGFCFALLGIMEYTAR